MIYLRYLPNTKQCSLHLPGKGFCGTYSEDGDIFISACQGK